MSKEKKPKAVKESRKAIEPTAENVKRAIAECSVPDVSLPAVRKLFGATWNEAAVIRHAAIKQLKAKS